MTSVCFKDFLDEANAEILPLVDETEWKKMKTQEIFQRVQNDAELCGCVIFPGAHAMMKPIIPCGGIKVKVNDLFQEFYNAEKRRAYALAKSRFNTYRKQ